MRKTLTLWIVLAASASTFGCAYSDTASSGSDLWELDSDAIPLASIDAAEWEFAPAGCEDRIPSDVTFEIAIGANGLLVAVDDDGAAVCTDTVEAIQEELEDTGRDEESDDLEASLVVTLGPSIDDVPEQAHIDPTADDPSPQPSCPNPEAMEEMVAPDDGESQPGDPSPQPS